METLLEVAGASMRRSDGRSRCSAKSAVFRARSRPICRALETSLSLRYKSRKQRWLGHGCEETSTSADRRAGFWVAGEGTVNFSDSRVGLTRVLSSKSLITRSGKSGFCRESCRFSLKLTVPRGLAKTWAMVEAKRARKAETPKQPSLCLRLRASYFYPTEASRLPPCRGPPQADLFD